MVTDVTVDAPVVHDRSAETLVAKARWFQSLSLEERMDYFCEMTDMILAVNPEVANRRDAEPVTGRIRVVRSPRV